MSLLNQTARNIGEFGLIPKTAAVLVAVSGGVDSVVLLDVLNRLAPRNGWALHVAHFNHQLRSTASDLDESFVRERAVALKLPFYSQSGSVRDLAEQEGISIEMAGRTLRHRFLALTAAQHGIHLVALAHHADDQVETFWFRMLRGDLGPGSTGMRWKRPSSEAPGVELIRPFLNIGKREILEYAQEARLPYREDLSNDDRAYERNRIRHEVLPALERFQPQLRTLTLRACDVWRAEKEFLAAAAADWLKTRAVAFDKLHVAVRREVIRLQLLEAGIRPTFDLIEQLNGSADPIVTVRRGLQVSLNREGTVCPSQETPKEFNPARTSVNLSPEGQISWQGLTVAWRVVAERGASAPGVEYFDAETVGSPITLRHWQPGDRFRPIGSAKTVKLQDLFTNAKVPAAQRRGKIVAETAHQEIFWVEGLRIAEHFKITNGTAAILRWSWARQ